MNSPRDSMNSPRDSMNSRRDQRVRGTDQNRTVPNEASQSQGRYTPSRSAPRGNAADVAGSMPDGGNRFGGARSAGNSTFGANQTDFADPELSAGDQWEPTGSSRKAWYDPQSSSPSDAPGEELPSEALSKPKLSSHRPQGLQAMSADAKKSLQRKTAAFRDSLRSTQGPAAPSGDQQLPVGDQQLTSRDQEMEWGSWQKGAPGSAAAGQQQEEEEGRENGRDRLLPGYQASKPVAQGRAKTIKLRYAASNISSHSIPYSLGCGASCDSSDILAQKHRCMWSATKPSWWEFPSKPSMTCKGLALHRALLVNLSAKVALHMTGFLPVCYNTLLLCPALHI